jgi:hypothetical protein
MHRCAINALALLWLIICVGTLALWTADHFAPPAGPPCHLAGRWYFRFQGTFSGNISVAFFHDFPTPNIAPPFGPGRQYTPAMLTWYDQLPPGLNWKLFGFDIEDDSNFEINGTNHLTVRGKQMGFAIPYWAAWLMWIPLILFADSRRRERIRRSRAGKGLCVQCGYDLRATPQQCPECGLIVAGKY